MTDANESGPWIKLSGDFVNVLHVARIARDRDGHAVLHFTDGGWMRCVESHSQVAPLVMAAHAKVFQKAEDTK